LRLDRVQGWRALSPDCKKNQIKISRSGGIFFCLPKLEFREFFKNWDGLVSML